MMINQLTRHLNPLTLAGAAVGGLGLIISFAGKGFLTWRQWGDPLPILLSFQQLIRGNFLYLDRFGLLGPPLFYATLGVITAAVLWRFGRLTSDDARIASRLAAIINVGIVALIHTDAFVVGMWYLMSGVVAVVIATAAAVGTAKLAANYFI